MDKNINFDEEKAKHIKNLADDIEYACIVDVCYGEVIEEHRRNGTLKMRGFFYNPYVEEAHNRAKEILKARSSKVL